MVLPSHEHDLCRCPRAVNDWLVWHTRSRVTQEWLVQSKLFDLESWIIKLSCLASLSINFLITLNHLFIASAAGLSISRKQSSFKYNSEGCLLGRIQDASEFCEGANCACIAERQINQTLASQISPRTRFGLHSFGYHPPSVRMVATAITNWAWKLSA